VKTTRYFAVLEVAGIGMLALVFGWLVAPRLELPRDRWEVILPILAISAYLGYVSPCLLFRDSLASRGLGSGRTGFIRLDNLPSSLRGYGSIALLGSGLILGIALWLRPDHLARLNWTAVLVKLGLYGLSATAQQLGFVGWLFPRLKAIFPETLRRLSPLGSIGPVTRPRLKVCVTAALLAVAFHYPNPLLMAICGIMGFALAWVSYDSPHLIGAATVHALLGTLLHRVAGLNMRIGPSYYQPGSYFFRTLFPSLERFLNPLF
jgi:hypothetical protein